MAHRAQVKHQLTFRAPNCVFGFLFPIRFFKDLMASLGATVLDRMMSDISRFKAMSSLEIGHISNGRKTVQLDIQCLQATTCRLLNLLIQGRVGR